MRSDYRDSKTLWYDNVYQSHKNGDRECIISVHSISKARTLVKHVWNAFGLSPMTNETSILDIGCGLGFVSEALRQAGGKVLGIDISNVAIECAKASFPQVDYACSSFDEIMQASRKFDIIWALDFSFINTNDVELVGNKFIRPCLDILNNNGMLILGWHTNFTGKDLGNYAQWNNAFIKKLKRAFDLSGPRVVKFRSAFLNWGIMHAYQALGDHGYSIMRKSIPIYFVLRKQ